MNTKRMDSKILSILLIFSMLLSVPVMAKEENVPLQPFSLTNARESVGVGVAGDPYIELVIGSPYIKINNKSELIDSLGSTPVIIHGRTMVPMRTIFEALGAEISWNPSTQEITAIRKNVTIKFAIGQKMATKNDKNVMLAVNPMIVNGVTMVPLQFIADSFDVETEWIESSSTIRIRESSKDYVILHDVKISLGDSLMQVKESMGEPNRIDDSPFVFDWYVYNSDYSHFFMIGIQDKHVSAIFTISKGFTTKYGSHGDVHVAEADKVRFYKDSHNSNKVYACMLAYDFEEKIPSNMQAYGAVEERQHFDLVNAFRASHGLSILGEDEIASKTAREHSEDMALQDFFSHTNLRGESPWDRYNRNKGSCFASGENLAAGNLTGIAALNGLINSAGHRSNLLSDHNYLGVGYAYNQASTYRYYLTEFFSK